jgi:hypothetical protein
MLLAFLDGLQDTGSDHGDHAELAASLGGAARTDDAERQLRQGIAYAESKEFTWDVIGGRLLLAKLLQKRERPGDAHREFERTHALALGAGHRLVVDDCEIGLEELGGNGTLRAGESPS